MGRGHQWLEGTQKSKEGTSAMGRGHQPWGGDTGVLVASKIPGK